MRRLMPAVLLVAGLALAAGGCKSSDRIINKAAKAVTTTAPRTGEAYEIRLIRGQIALYEHMHNEKPPPSLKAMSTLPRLKYGSDYVYDPSTGKIRSRTYPGI